MIKWNKETGLFEEPQEKLDEKQKAEIRDIERRFEEAQILKTVPKEKEEKREVTKEDIINEVLYLSANDSVSELITLKDVIEIQIDRIGKNDDVQLKQIQRVLDMFILERKSEDYQDSYQMVEPVIYDVTKKEDWDDVDVQIATRTAAHSIDFNAFREISKRIDDTGKDEYTVTMNYNALWRLTRIKFIEIYTNPLEKDTLLEDVEEEFKSQLESLNRICDERGYKVFKAVGLFREGVFFRDAAKANEAVARLRELDREDRVTVLLETVKKLHKEMPEEAKNVYPI